MKKNTPIPTLIQYRNNRLSPTEAREAQEWIRQHPNGDDLIRGLDTLMEQENHSEARIMAFLRERRRVLGRRLFEEL